MLPLPHSPHVLRTRVGRRTLLRGHVCGSMLITSTKWNRALWPYLGRGEMRRVRLLSAIVVVLAVRGHAVRGAKVKRPRQIWGTHWPDVRGVIMFAG